MGELLVVLAPILVADFLNPVLFAGTLYTLGTSRPIYNTLTMLLSFCVTYFLAGIIIALGLDYFSEAFRFPPGFDYAVELIVGIVLVIFGVKSYKEDYAPPDEKLRKRECMSTSQSASLGLQVNLIGLPFAIPYLGAIDQILKANISVMNTFGVLLMYNILYVLPFTSLVFILIIYKEGSHQIFQKINVWINRIADRYLPIIFVILGVVLFVDGAAYFIIRN